MLGPGINWTFPGFDRLVSTDDLRQPSVFLHAGKRTRGATHIPLGRGVMFSTRLPDTTSDLVFLSRCPDSQSLIKGPRVEPPSIGTCNMHKVLTGFAVVLALDCATVLAQKSPKPCGTKTAGRCKPPPPPAPIACVQGEWTVVSQSVTYSAWVTVGTSQERQRTTTTAWSRETLVQPANGGTPCGPSTQITTTVITETQPLPPGLAPPIPELANWEGRMTSYGAKHCNEAAIASAIGSAGVQSEDNVWYYDGTKVYQQIARYTQDSRWYTCAGYTNTAYRSYVLGATSSYALGGWRVFPHGLANDYESTGTVSSRDAAVRLSTYSAYAWSGGSSACGLSRETAYILQAYLVAEDLGEPRHPKFATAVDNALLQLYQSLVTRRCSSVSPFVMGLTMEALIRYYEATGDSRVPPAIEVAADAMWVWLWNPASESFVSASTNLTGGAPDLNLLIAPAYAWLWQVTGAPRHLDRGDAIFAGGVRRAWLGAGKAFSQNYRWSFDYVKWRSQPPGTIEPLTRY